jgi:signal transduction histidine kinase
MPLSSRSSNTRAVEAERQRIARTIHDSVTQEIAVVIWQLRMACGSAPQAPEQTEILRALEMAEAAMGHLRGLMRELRGNGVSDRPMRA